MAAAPPIVLTIAGFDPSSGAGITADIKTIAAHECFGVACITALTVQSTQGVRRVEGIDPKLVAETLEELASDLAIEAVHIGMLGNAFVVKVVADFLTRNPLPHVVLDPIVQSSSGADLLDPAGIKLMPHRHHEDRVYTVVSGVFYIGLGEQFDDAKLEAYPPGAVIVLPGGTPHFHWAKSGEYITQVTAIGPITLDYVDPEDDPRNK